MALGSSCSYGILLDRRDSGDSGFAMVDQPPIAYCFRIVLCIPTDFWGRLYFNTVISPLISSRSITKSYYRNSVGALLVYDICNRESFDSIPSWMMEAKRHIEPHSPVFALVGCKLDLVRAGATREVTEEEAKAFAQRHGIFHVETSAKTGLNVEQAFTAVTQEVYNRIQSGEYKIEDGWDGIKAGYARPSGMDYNLVEAESAKSTCC